MTRDAWIPKYRGLLKTYYRRHYVAYFLNNKKCFNTFASQCSVFEEKKGTISPWKCINLTHELLYESFNKKILLNFLVRIIIQKLLSQIWCLFKEKWFIFFLKNEALRCKKLIYKCRINLHIYTISSIIVLFQTKNESTVRHCKSFF